MAFKMRSSKFRHVFGKPLKKELCYDALQTVKSSIDSLCCAVNPKFVAIIHESAGGGSFYVLPLEKTGRIERGTHLVAGHAAAILDIKWCPHNDNVIASSSEDSKIKIWSIPEAWGENLTAEDAVVTLEQHQKKVGVIEWHPTAHNILLSSGDDCQTVLWNCETGEKLWAMSMPDKCFSLSFNRDGTKFVTTCKDKFIRVYSTRECELLSETAGHNGAKPSMAVFLKHDKIFTTGFSKMSERQYALWDVKNKAAENLLTEGIDNSNGVIFPLYDADVDMLWLCGKGDSIIRFYEVTEETPYVHYLNLYQAKDQQKGICCMPKRGLNVNSCEIARFYKLINYTLCEVIPFTVPRKSELFQEDLYPDTAGDEATVTAEEFMAGKKSDPILIPLKSGYTPAKKAPMTVKKNLLATPLGSSASATNNAGAKAAPPAAPAGPALPAGFDAKKLMSDVAELKSMIKQQDKKIAALEKQMEESRGTAEENENQEA